MPTQEIKSIKGLALRHPVAKPRRSEAFLNGAISGDNLILAYGSCQRRQISPRKWERVTTTRIVKCERAWTEDGEDYRWMFVGQTILSHTG